MEKERGSFRYLLVLYIILTAVTGAVVLFTYPIIKRNIEESGIIGRYMEWKREKEDKSGSYSVTLYSESGYVSVERNVEKKSDDMHGVIEALLLSPDENEEDKGYTSYIPEGTSLIGISGKDGYFFVELSTAFLSSLDIEKAGGQIKKTLESCYTLESLTIICGTKIIRI